jgi:hypothetical protein
MAAKSPGRYATNRPEIDRLASFLLSFGHKLIIALQFLEHDCVISQSTCSRPRITAKAGAR